MVDLFLFRCYCEVSNTHFQTYTVQKLHIPALRVQVPCTCTPVLVPPHENMYHRGSTVVKYVLLVVVLQYLSATGSFIMMMDDKILERIMENWAVDSCKHRIAATCGKHLPQRERKDGCI